MTRTAAGRTVYIDATPLGDTHLTGIGRYTARLALAMGRLAPTRFFSGDQEILPPAVDWTPDQDLQEWGRSIWRSPRRALGAVPPESLCIYPCLRPEERRFPFEVSVLHDFTPLIVPGTHSEHTRGMFQGFFAKTLLSSDAAISVSHSTKADAAWLCDFPQERIAVAHSGPSLCVERHCHAAPVARRKDVGLVVSTIEPRKNAFFLLEWFKNTQSLPANLELWWVGPMGWLTSKAQLKPYERLAGGRKVRFLGVVSDAKLCELYQTAGFSVYPSLYEGFGFPVLDALRHGAPVFCGYHSSLREFADPALHFFDPCDAATLDDAWRAAAESPQSPRPREAFDAHYNWTAVARRVLDLPATARGAAPSGCVA
jgi:glycosyltransferase involved in cell wall biosynthesis